MRIQLVKLRLFLPSLRQHAPCSSLSHLDSNGSINFVDVSSKATSKRVAVAETVIQFNEPLFRIVKENKMKKGDLLSTVKLAGIMACKRTSDLIPLCHNIPLSNASLSISLNADDCTARVSCKVGTIGQTGCEMEALTGASIAALALYDMCKSYGHQNIQIQGTKLLFKSGGKSDFTA